ncbi:hypothetical protein CVT24_000895, partial [Panaeolus cyanescens]
TRSGNQYSIPFSPIWSPPAFQLSEALERALAFDNDETSFGFNDSASTRDNNGFETHPLTQVDAGNVEAGGVDVELCGELEEGEVLEKPYGGIVGGTDGIVGGTGVDMEEGEIFENGGIVGNGKGNKAKRQCLHRQKQKAKKFDLYGHLPSSSAIQSHIGTASQVLVDVDLPSLPFARCGFQAINERNDQTTILTHIYRVSRPIVDRNSGKVFGVVVGTLDDPTYHESARKAFEYLEEVSKDVQFESKETHHRRGDFTAVTYGVSYGQGSQLPHWLRCPHDELMRKAFSNEHIKRLATFASYAFAMWAPNVYSYYRNQISLLLSKMPSLKWTFYNTIWLCATINFGPHVCCLPHRDLLNLPFGWCSIIALGDFDYRKGGHLVLHDLRMIIEFPPGCVVLIPSALLNHANTPLQPGERRMSFTQFCAGSIFRFIENGFRTEKQLKKDDKKMYEEMMRAKEGRREMGIGLWSTLNELLALRST